MDEPTWLEKARGYIDLGMHEEAWAELEALPEDLLGRPEALEMRIIVLLDRSRFEEALEIAETLAESDAEHHAGFIQGGYALHALGRTQDAIDFLQTGPESLREEQCYFYNLACYEVALGRPEAALTWLLQSIELDARNRLRALSDTDLAPLHDLIPPEK